MHYFALPALDALSQRDPGGRACELPLSWLSIPTGYHSGEGYGSLAARGVYGVYIRWLGGVGRAAAPRRKYLLFLGMGRYSQHQLIGL